MDIAILICVNEGYTLYHVAYCPSHDTYSVVSQYSLHCFEIILIGSFRTNRCVVLSSIRLKYGLRKINLFEIRNTFGWQAA